MNCSPQEAEQALNDLDAVERKTRTYTVLKGSDHVCFLWGMVWIIGFVLQHWLSRHPVSMRIGSFTLSGSGLFWTPLVLAAGILTYVIFLRTVPTRSKRLDELARAVGPMWLALYAYAGFWLVMTETAAGEPLFQGAAGMRALTTVASTLPMLALVLMGLYGCGRFLIVEGLLVTLATGIGFYMAGDWFYLYMAVAGGGIQLATAGWVRHSLRRTA